MPVLPTGRCILRAVKLWPTVRPTNTFPGTYGGDLDALQ